MVMPLKPYGNSSNNEKLVEDLRRKNELIFMKPDQCTTSKLSQLGVRGKTRDEKTRSS